MRKFPSPACLLLLSGLLIWTGRATADDWPQWRGPRRDGISRETGLLRQWPEGGPKVAWQIDTVGVGYSSPSIQDGRVITLGDLDGVEHVIAVSEKDGSLLWAVQPEPVARELAAMVEERFGKFDADGDGRLDELEAMQSMGWRYNDVDRPLEGDKTEIAAVRTARLMEQLDEDGNGKLTYDEAPSAMQREFDKFDQEDKGADGIALAKQRTAALLASADEDLDGKVSKQESRSSQLRQWFGQIDQKDKSTGKGDDLLTAEEIRTYLFARQPGRDGMLTAAEIADYFEQKYPGRDGILTAADVRRMYGGYRNGMGDGPRGTPTIDGDYVYVEGGNGDLTCIEAATGKTVWHVNLSQDLGGGRPGWGYCESPLIDGDLVIVTPGGKQGTIAALDKRTGKVVWRSQAVGQPAHYSSPQIAEIAGVRQIVQFARESVFGISDDGSRLLWSYSAANNGTANCSTPIVDNDRVLASSAYGTGTGMVRISPGSDGGQQQAEEAYFQDKLQSHHGGLVKVGDHLYGFGRGLMCLDFDSGEIVWQDRSVNKGSLICADGMLYCLGERHEVALVEATPEEYRERGRFKIESHGRPSWAHPVVANGRLYIRDQESLTVYDIGGQ